MDCYKTQKSLLDPFAKWRKLLCSFKICPFTLSENKNTKGKLGIFFLRDSDYVQDECLIDGICECYCYGMNSGLRVPVDFFNDGLLDVCFFMVRVGIEQSLGFAKDE